MPFTGYPNLPGETPLLPPLLQSDTPDQNPDKVNNRLFVVKVRGLEVSKIALSL